jgi:hypothetical protein
MKRKRINATAICSSANYAASKKAHRLMLETNHKENEALLMTVSNSMVITPKSDLELWEEWLKEQIRLFKANRKKEERINPFR